MSLATMTSSLTDTAASALAAVTLAAGDPVAHVANHYGLKANLFGIENVWIWSGHIGNLVLSLLILIIVGPWVAKRIATGPESMGAGRYVTSNKFAHMIEVLCVYLRDEVVRPLLGSRTDKMMPFLWTLFFFLWVNNLLGMIPLLDFQAVPQYLSNPSAHPKVIVGGTATQSLYTTAVMATIAFIMINLSGIRELGVGGYLAHLTGGAPWYIWPIIVPVEIVGTFVKPFALAIRLFANMTAGHILLATLLGFIAVGVKLLASGGNGLALGPIIIIASGIGSIAIYFLEIFVATLQAFVFMFLTTVFISQLAHHDDHEHGEAQGHEHAHA
jgi:F-type H+-transporting ATPase subunit a